jgi:hypothetical protein
MQGASAVITLKVEPSVRDSSWLVVTKSTMSKKAGAARPAHPRRQPGLDKAQQRR